MCSTRVVGIATVRPGIAGLDHLRVHVQVIEPDARDQPVVAVLFVGLHLDGFAEDQVRKRCLSRLAVGWPDSGASIACKRTRIMPGVETHVGGVAVRDT